MSVPISPGSPRAVHAKVFARELRKAMTARGASAQRLAEASGCMKSSIGAWRAGQNLPQPSTAARMAEALDWSRLTTIATDARRKDCPRCGASYVDSTGAGNRQFCSPECRLVDSQLRKPSPSIALHSAIRIAMEARLAGAPERETLPATLAALRDYETSTKRMRDRADGQEQRLRSITDAVDAMCRSCEPEGLCRTAECPLRAFSPLPMASERPVAAVRPPSSPHAPENRDRWLAATRAGSQRRWDRPGERERMGASMQARHAALTEEERRDRGARISAGRRRKEIA